MQLQTRSPGMRGHTVKVNGNVYAVDKDLCVEVEDESDIQKLLAVGWTDEILRAGVANSRPKAGPRPKVVSSLGSAKNFVELVARDEKLQEKCAACQTFSELHALAQGLGFGFTKPQLEQAREAYIKRVAPQPPKASAPPNPHKIDLERTLKNVEKPEEEAAAPSKVSSPQGSYDKKVLESVVKETGLTAEAILAKAFEVDEAGAQTGEFSREDLHAAALTLLAEVSPPPIPDEDDSEEDSELPAELPDGTPAKEWPEPDESMKMDYLRKMADAYEVEGAASMRKKAELIEAIMAAMYE